MALAPGTRLGPYEISAQIGAGGMGEVYRATDSNLKRQVAVKVLPEALAGDAERLARFQREAEVLAALNHPNIAAIYGLERSDGRVALVMELVEGPTLADRIAEGAIPLDEAVPIARQLAEALEAAHEQGIIHRDLKPANVKLAADGRVKVLDFGLAKAIEPASAVGTSAGQPLSMSPTITTPAMTQAGIVLGTAAYMAPEQARGRAVDKRADIWAFGVVLYEMVTGRRPFEGEDLTETLAAVVKTDPDLGQVPPSLRRLIARCLQKDPRKRLRDISGVELLLDGDQSEAEGVSPRTTWLPWAVAAVAAIVAAMALLGGTRPSAPPAEVRLELTTPPTRDATAFAISPDGRQLAYVATVDRRNVLFLRSLESGDTRMLVGTEGATSPFWSPDSRNIAFRTGGQLRRIELERGSVQTIAPVQLPSGGGAWSPAGDILFPPLGPTGILRVSESGGTGTRVTPEQPALISQYFPWMLPDGQHFLFTSSSGDADVAGVYVASLVDTEVQRLLPIDTPAAYVAGQLLFRQEGSLFAQAFDVETLALSGTASVVSDDVGAFSVSNDGTIVIRPPTEDTFSMWHVLTWFDRSGQVVGTLTASGMSPTLSPDGKRLAVFRNVNAGQDIWIIDLERDAATRFTSYPGPDLHPLWSPDGSRILFVSNRDAPLAAYEKPVAGGEETLLEEAQGLATDWSRDGRFILFRGQGIWATPMDGSGDPFPWVGPDVPARDGKFSPDGRWVAYASNESGRYEIYLQSFPTAGRKFPVSRDGGMWPQWRADGQELFFVALDNQLMAVPVTLRPEADPDIGSPTALFPTQFQSVVGIDPQQYVVSTDGERFLASVAVDETPPPLTVILNWRSPSPE